MNETIQYVLIGAIGTLSILYLFRNQLKRLSIKAGPVELDIELFEKENQKLAAEARTLFPALLKNANELAKQNPRRAIMDSWNKLENAGIAALKRRQVKFRKNTAEYRKNLQVTLAGEKILNERELQIFNGLRNARNAAKYAGSAYDSKITPGSAMDYIEAASRLEEYLKNL